MTEYNDAKWNWGVTFGLQSYARWIALNQSGVLAQTRPLAGTFPSRSGEKLLDSAIGSATDASRDIALMVDTNHLMLAPLPRRVRRRGKGGGMASSPRYADRRIQLAARWRARDGVVSLVTMDRLHDRELRTLVGFANDASRIARFEPRRFEAWVVEHVAALIPADAVHVTVRRLPYRPDDFYLIGDYPQFAAFRNSSEGRAEWGRLVQSHPFGAERLQHPKETRSLRLSDFVTDLQLRQLEFYEVFLRPFALNYCITGRFFGLRRVYDLAIARSRVDFAPRDLLLLDVVTTVLGLAIREPPRLVPQQLAGSVGITVREAQILEQVARGRSNVEIAAALNLAPGTVKKHLDNIFEKLGVHNRIEATRIWVAEAEEAASVTPDEDVLREGVSVA